MKFFSEKNPFSPVQPKNISPGLNSIPKTISPSSPEVSALSLEQCYALALKQSEKVALKQQLINEARARFQQSLGSLLPHASFETSEKRQNGSNGSAFTLTEIPESKFVFSQPLFSGFKEFASMSASRAQNRQYQQEMRRAKQLLFIDVSDVFYLFLDYQEERKALANTQEALAERVEELKKREHLGRSRASEVASAEVRLNRNEAQLELIRSQMEVSRQLLEFLTGVSITTIVDSPDTEFLMTLSVNLDEYLKKSSHRPDVLAAKEAWESSRNKIGIARADYWPNASLDGNYYTKRVGNSADVDWDVTLSVSVPIFSGGETSAKVKEAIALAKGDDLRFQEVQRTAVLEIQNAYTKFQTASKRYHAFKKALESAEKNYQFQKDDYEKNLVSNLDVLLSLEDLQDAHRDFIISHFEAKRRYWNLMVAVGEVE